MPTRILSSPNGAPSGGWSTAISPRPLTPRTILNHPDSGFPSSSVIGPEAIRSMYSATGLASVIDCVDVAGAGQRGEVDAMADVGIAAAIRIAEVGSAGEPADVRDAIAVDVTPWNRRARSEVDFRAERVGRMRQVHDTLGRIPLVVGIVGALLEHHVFAERNVLLQLEIVELHIRRDVFLIELEHPLEVVLREHDPVLGGFGREDDAGYRTAGRLPIDKPLTVFVLQPARHRNRLVRR